MNTQKIDFKNLSPDEIASYFESKGEPKYRSSQLIEWLFQKKISAFSEITNFPKALIAQLEETGYISALSVKSVQESQDGTRKFLFQLEDGETIETVLMPHKERLTLCISTQVGCRMGCRFCLTAKQSLIRQLKASEILNQIIEVQKMAPRKITNIVMMGMGEPLDNFENVVQAIDYICSPKALEFAPRRVTVSTSGLASKIEELGKRTKVNLAISLNASNNKTRTDIMPVNKPFPIEKLIEVTKKFYSMNKRGKVMFEYVLLKGVNDSQKDALKLAQYLKGTPFKVNLIPFNEHSELAYKQPSSEGITQFQDILRQNKVFSFVRWSKGRDISAACGQLRSLMIQNKYEG